MPIPERLIANLASALNVSKEAITGALIDAALIVPPIDPTKPPKIAPERWIDRPRTSRESVIKFIERVYQPWLGKSLSRPDIRRLDLPLYRALAKHIERYGLDLDLPDRTEAITRKLKSRGIKRPSDVQLADADRHDTKAVDEAKNLARAAEARLRLKKRSKTPHP